MDCECEEQNRSASQDNKQNTDASQMKTSVYIKLRLSTGDYPVPQPAFHCLLILQKIMETATISSYNLQTLPQVWEIAFLFLANEYLLP